MAAAFSEGGSLFVGQPRLTAGAGPAARPPLRV